jgi:hypothetical protein
LRPGFDELLRLNRKIARRQEVIAKRQEIVARRQDLFNRAFVKSFEQRAVSNDSDRELHEVTFKANLIEKYKRHAGVQTHLRCMVLDAPIAKERIKAAHLVSLQQESAFSVVGCDLDDKWDPCNGLLLFESIEKAYNSQELTFLLHPHTGVITVQILYDDLLDKEIVYDRSWILGTKAYQKSVPRTFNDINGTALKLPSLVYPSRRILLWAAHSAFDRAVKNSGRSHLCADVSCPNEEGWKELAVYVNASSPNRSSNLYARILYDSDGDGSEGDGEPTHGTSKASKSLLADQFSNVPILRPMHESIFVQNSYAGKGYSPQTISDRLFKYQRRCQCEANGDRCSKPASYYCTECSDEPGGNFFPCCGPRTGRNCWTQHLYTVHCKIDE